MLRTYAGLQFAANVRHAKRPKTKVPQSRKPSACITVKPQSLYWIWPTAQSPIV